MAALRLFAALVLAGWMLPASAQTRPSSSDPVPALEAALTGTWTGVLEYRDYSEPPSSSKRVQLPTWLTIDASGAPGLRWHYVYDDGPNKVVEETDNVRVDARAGTYTEQDNDHPAVTYQVAGFDKLRDGRGDLVLTGSGTDNGKPAELRLSLAVRRNLLTVLEESRPRGSAEAFTFRHRYVFTRATPPRVSATR